MAARAAVIAQVARVASAAGADESALTDRELLRLFAAGDESAFAVLVTRHGRMVLGVCRRFLPTVQDAEDACQATFLILARKAKHQRWRPSVANWLYTTARRVAAKARRSADRRTKRESQAARPEAVAPTDDLSGRELLAALDEELARLPARYREPLVLCYLEGLSREEAAARLGVPQGTVKTRLERGRHRLEEALTKRGVIGLGLLAFGVTTPTGAAPSRLVESVLAAVAGPTPAAVSALAREAGMNSALRLALVAVVVLVPAVGLGIGWRASGPTAEASAPVALVLAPVVKGANPVAVAPVPRQADEKLQKDIAAAREKAIDFLKKKHDENTHWEGALLNALADMEGGMTALATLGLLEAGVAADDAVVAKAIDYLAKLEPKKTYVVSLQTQVLARADAKKYKEQIQKNADWLLEKMIGKEDKIEGWSYPGNLIADNSNTHFAVMGLHAAAQAGAKIDRKVWDRLREFYTRTQARDGGWMYHNEFASQSSLSMTTCGLLGLTIADKYDKNAKQPGVAFEKGIKKLAPWTMESPKSTYYAMHAVAELGRTAGKTEFKSGDKTWAWYREGASKLLKEQKADGSWATGTTSVDGSPVYATACALYFLGPAKK